MMLCLMPACNEVMVTESSVQQAEVDARLFFKQTITVRKTGRDWVVYATINFRDTLMVRYSIDAASTTTPEELPKGASP